MDQSYLSAYAAGLFDGEGWMYISAKRVKNRPGRYLFKFTVGITMTEPRPLHMLQAVYGGSMCKPTQLPGKSQIYAWQVGVRNAERFLRDIVEWSQVKHARIENALRYYSAGLRQANSRGGKILTPEQIDLRLQIVRCDQALVKKAYRRKPKLALTPE